MRGAFLLKKQIFNMPKTKIALLQSSLLDRLLR